MDRRFENLGFGALQASFILFFMLASAVPFLPDGQISASTAGVSAAGQPMQSAILSKKDAARAVLTADRRQAPKSRWSDPQDGLLPAPFALRLAAVDGESVVAQSDTLSLRSRSLVFRARAPPRLTS